MTLFYSNSLAFLRQSFPKHCNKHRTWKYLIRKGETSTNHQCVGVLMLVLGLYITLNHWVKSFLELQRMAKYSNFHCCQSSLVGYDSQRLTKKFHPCMTTNTIIYVCLYFLLEKDHFQAAMRCFIACGVNTIIIHTVPPFRIFGVFLLFHSLDSANPSSHFLMEIFHSGWSK